MINNQAMDQIDTDNRRAAIRAAIAYYPDGIDADVMLAAAGNLAAEAIALLR